MKLHIMIIMIIPIGNAEMILTDWILLIELSENTRAIGNTISKMHHNKVIIVCTDILIVKLEDFSDHLSLRFINHIAFSETIRRSPHRLAHKVLT